MSPLEKRAWLGLLSMGLPYCVYFGVLIALPDWQATFLERIGFLAAVSLVHAAAYVTGLLVMRRQEAGECVLQDERDQAIDSRATRRAYFMMLASMLLVGVIMPFESSGWALANTGLLCVVLTEAVRCVLVAAGYRWPRHAV
ncbi:hypothetical protein [Xanthomonas sp. XNM01]|uniref:hypothetical protein n=1 Tax=Xanthomonas sp. XNM01 TaxID=2769289 RepID=UPI00177F5E06|nr:hypothetical protein [Xanthomonas sp. XNM01]MBD9368492.1 hypothetical protein [Xanthomonas sp. XNM01]